MIAVRFRALLLAAVLLPATGVAGDFNFGMISAVKKKVDEIKAPVEADRAVTTPARVLVSSNVVSVSEYTIVLRADSPEAAGLAKGSIVVMGVTSLTPDGLLRKVVATRRVGDNLEVVTTVAALEEAIPQGEISLSQRMLASDLRYAAIPRGSRLAVNEAGLLELTFSTSSTAILFDRDGNLGTKDDQVTLTGTLTIDSGFQFDVKIRDFKLDRLRFVNTTTVKQDLDFRADAIWDLLPEKRIAVFRFAPVTVLVPMFPLPIPVVLTPVVTVHVGANLTVTCTAKAQAKAEVTAGLEYANAKWGPIADHSVSFLPWTPTLTAANGTVKAYGGPQFKLLIFGLAGPYVKLYGNLGLDVNLLQSPWWKLSAWLEAGAGVRVDLFSRTLANYELFPLLTSPKLVLLKATDAPPLAPGVAPPAVGSLAGAVRDAVTNTTLVGVGVSVSTNSSVTANATSGSDGSYSATVSTGGGYTVQFSKSGYLPVTYSNVAVTANTTTYLEAVLQIDTAYSGTGSVSGTIADAATGAGVSGLTINLRSGVNVTAGAVVATAVTGGGGVYSITNLVAGNYTAEVAGSGYVTTYFTIVSVGGTTRYNQNASISPSGSDTRIVLTWGATPSDLDSHLTGPTPGTTSRFHVYYSNKGSLTGSPYSALDVDDVTSYGPETVTIPQQFSGVYRYSVHDYTNRYATTSTALPNSGAQVKVWRGSSLAATYNVPNQGGTLWTVFEMDGNTITPINLMKYESSPSNTASFAPPLMASGAGLEGVQIEWVEWKVISGTDAEVIRSMPAK